MWFENLCMMIAGKVTEKAANWFKLSELNEGRLYILTYAVAFFTPVTLMVLVLCGLLLAAIL